MSHDQFLDSTTENNLGHCLMYTFRGMYFSFGKAFSDFFYSHAFVFQGTNFAITIHSFHKSSAIFIQLATTLAIIIKHLPPSSGL